MLCTMFLPIMLALGVFWYMLIFHMPEHIQDDQAVVLGLPVIWLIYAGMTLPLLLWLVMLGTGNWRRPVLLAAVVYFTAFFLAAFEFVKDYTPPEKRPIVITGHKGTDIYCNGVHLGQVPLRIRVDELKAKVPEWTESEGNGPPEQRWYDDTEPALMVFTWFPWDDFRRERFEASKELFGANNNRIVSNVPRAVKARRDALSKHDAGCRYWWSFRHGESQMANYRIENPYYLNRPFDRTSDYNLRISATPFSPSAVFHARLLADVLPELTPEEKTNWDRHVLKHWTLIDRPLSRALLQAGMKFKRDKNDPLAKLYGTALHSTARLKWNLSDPPTEDECCRLFDEWVAASVKDNLFFFDNEYYSGLMNGSPSEAGAAGDILLPKLGDEMRKALTEQWRKNKYRYESGWAPVAYFSHVDRSPDYFADFARYSAVTHNARLELLGNKDPKAAALFKTLLHRRSGSDLMNPRETLYAIPIEIFSRVDNPRAEPEFRQYVVAALSDPNHDDTTRELTNRAVFNAIMTRIYHPDTDKDELAAWVSSLPLKPTSKNLALRMIRIRGDNAKTFADRLQQAASHQVLIETELTLDDVVKWFEENPKKGLVEFLGEHEDAITVSDVFDNKNMNFGTFSVPITSFAELETIAPGTVIETQQYAIWGDLPKCFIRALLRSDTPEGDPKIRALIRQLWGTSLHYVAQAVQSEYGMVNPLRYGDSFNDTGSANLPDYLLDLCENIGIQPGNDGFGLSTTLALCDSPKAGALLEKWAAEVHTSAKPQFQRCLEIWRTRNVLRQKKKELYHDLVADRITPDDLLLKQPPWVWKDGRYVQGE